MSLYILPKYISEGVEIEIADLFNADDKIKPEYEGEGVMIHQLGLVVDYYFAWGADVTKVLNVGAEGLDKGAPFYAYESDCEQVFITTEEGKASEWVTPEFSWSEDRGAGFIMKVKANTKSEPRTERLVVRAFRGDGVEDQIFEESSITIVQDGKK